MYRVGADRFHLLFANKEDARKTAVWLSISRMGMCSSQMCAKLPGPVVVKLVAPDGLLEKRG
ncbi:MAG: hypothetical protein M5U34_25820 [Chloroflexi bacterium]|nr:hypothetical protein [Chloroflexota bacterium]